MKRKILKIIRIWRKFNTYLWTNGSELKFEQIFWFIDLQILYIAKTISRRWIFVTFCIILDSIFVNCPKKSQSLENGYIPYRYVKVLQNFGVYPELRVLFGLVRNCLTESGSDQTIAFSLLFYILHLPVILLGNNNEFSFPVDKFCFSNTVPVCWI